MAQQLTCLDTIKNKYQEQNDKLRQQELDMRARIDNLEKLLTEANHKTHYGRSSSMDHKSNILSNTSPVSDRQNNLSCPRALPSQHVPCKPCSCSTESSTTKLAQSAAEAKYSPTSSLAGCCCGPKEIVEPSVDGSAGSCDCSGGGVPNIEKEKTEKSALMCPELCNGLFKQFMAMLPSGKQAQQRSCDIDEVPVKDNCVMGGPPQKQLIGNGRCPCKLCSINVSASPNNSNISLQTSDIENIRLLNELFEEQKNINSHIDDLAQKVNHYESMLRLQSSAEPHECSCSVPERSNLKSGSENGSSDLIAQNKMLQSQLNEIKQEIRKCVETVDTPIQLQCRNERLKTQQLEEQLEDLKIELLSSCQFYQEEVNTMKRQLSCLRCELYELAQSMVLSDELIDALNRRLLNYLPMLNYMKYAIIVVGAAAICVPLVITMFR